MRSRDGGKKRPCTYCKTPTMFERQVVGPRGAHLRWEDCCGPCGEEPERRERKDAAA